MPNLDGGHYFLTAIVPIDNRGLVQHGQMKSSPIHMLRETLETLPTALQSKAAESVGVQSPFARSQRTHFLRLVILDEPFFNGRNGQDSILSAVFKTPLLQAQPTDLLACPYLMVMVDFDPVGDGQEEPRAYLEELWSLAEAELRAVFSYAYGFAEVRDAAGFADLIIACQVETTMPFNDYWTTAPPFPTLSLWALAAAPILGAGLGVVLWHHVILPWLLLPALVLLGLAFDVWLLMWRGSRPLPTAPASTLAHVLKALYLQQAFTRFAVAQQGAEPADLRAAFAAFVAQHRPSDLTGPTQRPGVIRSPLSEAADA